LHFEFESKNTKLSNELSFYISNASSKNREVESPIGITYSGDTFITNQNNIQDYDMRPSEQSDVSSIPFDWDVETYDIEALDIQELRNYFSDFAIRNAINSHLKANDITKSTGLRIKKLLQKNYKNSWELEIIDRKLVIRQSRRHRIG